MAHVAQYKKDVVKRFVDLMKEYPIVGAINMENMPAPQLQTMKSQLRDTAEILMTKRRLMKIALEQVKGDLPGIEKLEEHLRGMPALLFTKENPFKIFKFIQDNKSNAPAKGGQTAPNDIVVPAGPTSFAPGPIIGELGAIGLKTGVEDGKIAIKEDAVVVKDGEVIEQKTAELLTRLGIEPMEIGLDLVAVYEGGSIFTKDILAVDEQEYIDNITQAAAWAHNLAVEAAYVTKDNVELILGKAFNDSKGLALESNFMADAVAEELVAKAERQMNSLKDTANISTEAPVEEKKEEPAPEAPVEEPKEEEKPKEEPKAEEKSESLVESAEKAAENVEKEMEEKVKEDVEKIDKDIKELKEDIEEKKEEIKEDIKELKENPDPEKVEEIKEDIQELKEDIKKEEAEIKEDIEEAKKDIDNMVEAKQEDVVPEPEEKVVEKLKEDEQKAEEQIKEDAAEIKKIEEEAATVEEKKEVQQEAKDLERLEKDAIKEAKEEESLPSADDLIKQTKDQYSKEKKEDKKPTADEIVEEVKKESPKPKEDEASKLFKELQKKGTLRGVGVQKEQAKPSEKFSGDVPTAAELMDRAKKKGTVKKEPEKVPSAHELMKKKLEKEGK